VQPKPVVQGTWRGLEVNTGYTPGEWGFVFSGDNVTISGPMFNLTGTILSSVTEMDVVVISATDSTLAGKTLKGIYESDFGPATLFLTWGLAPAGVTPLPGAWGTLMKDTKSWVWILEQPKVFGWW
jgi:hypothetical protein